MRLYRRGIPDDLVAMIPELIAFFLVCILCCAYIHAVGRAIADGIAGSLLGATILGISGIFVGLMIPYDPTGAPFPMLIGGAAGGMIGSPLGASVHRKFNNSKGTDSQ